jgi:DNA-binding response OmpR family regulator
MPKILVIDDDLNILEIYKDLLLKTGFEIQTAEDAVSALTKFQEFKPDLLILDVDMPAGGGTKVFERVRNILMSPIPIIFSTAIPDSVQEYAKASAVSIIRKPINTDDLLAEIKKLLKLGT